MTRTSLEIYQTLSGDQQPLLATLYDLQKKIEQLVNLDPTHQHNLEVIKSNLIELEEVSNALRSYHSRIEFNPARAEEVNERLKLLNRIKRKYGPTVKEICEYHTHTAEKLNHLEKASVQIEELQNELQRLQDTNNVLAGQLTEKRKFVAKQLEKEMNLQLKALNMPKAFFYVEISPQRRSKYGDDHVEFFFAPNVGEKKISIKECASGGELSRLMLALQTLLAGKENMPTLVFDEIDANIGGETAKVVGEKLQQISLRHQVLCITHFPQVAICAEHHLQISKNEVEGRTFTQITLLDKKTRKKEFSRMIGK